MDQFDYTHFIFISPENLSVECFMRGISRRKVLTSAYLWFTIEYYHVISVSWQDILFPLISPLDTIISEGKRVIKTMNATILILMVNWKPLLYSRRVSGAILSRWIIWSMPFWIWARSGLTPPQKQSLGDLSHSSSEPNHGLLHQKGSLESG